MLSHQTVVVVVNKLTGCDAFIVFDLGPEQPSAGIVRSAPKILVDGATTLARSLTYLFATFEQQMGGASCGVNAKPEGRGEALASFITEVGPAVRAGSLQLVAGQGVSDGDLAPLRDLEPGDRIESVSRDRFLATGVVAAAVRAHGDLAGTRVAVDGLDRSSTAVVASLARAGAQIVAVASSAGTLVDTAGLDVDQLIGLVDEHGPAGVEQLGDLGSPSAVFAAEADIVVTGSKVGAIDHDAAAVITAALVVPMGPVPVTAKALAVLRRSGKVVLPDFVTAAGPWFAAFADASVVPDEVDALVGERIATALDDVLGHEDGPLLASCRRAEAFLGTWRDELPFGRPLA